MNRYEKRCLDKYYLSIRDIPAVNWFKMYEDADYTQLSRTGKVCGRAQSVHEKLQDQLIDTFGVSEEFKKLHELRKKLEIKRAEYARTGNKLLLFNIDMIAYQIKELSKSDQKKTNLYHAIAWIKDNGITFDENTLTLFWYYTYLEYLSEKARRNKSLTDGGK